MVCNTEECCGCGACISICPKKCIKLTTNDLGVILPAINQAECINCGLCDKTCPKIGENKLNSPRKCYAAYLKDNEKRLDCASGGVARAMYEKFLEVPDSYIVGVCWDKEFNPVFKLTNDKEYIKMFQGSKYVQAFPENIYSQIEEKLKADNRVLFIGMPCQIAAAKKYFETKNINTENLVLVDILCHGVSPYQYLKEEILYYKSKWNLPNLLNISFRSNRRFSNYHFCMKYKNGSFRIKKFNRFAYEDPYFNSFLDASSLRESCYSCNFSKLERVSDVTIGDFIGLGKMQSSTQFEGIVANASLILTNTEQGQVFINKLENDLYIFERPIQEAYEGGASLQKPYRKSKWRDKFVKYYRKGKFVQTMNKIGGCEFKIKQLKLHIIRIFYGVYLTIKGIEH